MAVKNGRFGVSLLLLLILCGCTLNRPAAISRLALLAPFEGRYREVGYDAYYAVKLALADSGGTDIELLAVDDGGSVATAVDRAHALQRDPLVKAVLVLGDDAANAQTQQAFTTLPVLIVGDWSSQPQAANIFVLASQQATSLISPFAQVGVTAAASLQAPIVGGDIFALRQFPLLATSTAGIRILSSGSLPDATFRDRYLKSASFVPEPGLLTTLTYDAANMAVQVIHQSDPRAVLASMTYNGLNGAIHFANGYWVNAPIHYYCYERSTIQSPSAQDSDFTLHLCS